MRRSLCIFFAFVTGWIVYMIAMVLTVYDGLLSLIFQPIMAALCSGLFVALALVVGLVLKIPFISRWWRATPAWALLLIFGGVFVLCFGSSLGITAVYTDHESGGQFTGLHWIAALTGYFALIFALTNWPLRAKNGEPGNPPNSLGLGRLS